MNYVKFKPSDLCNATLRLKITILFLFIFLPTDVTNLEMMRLPPNVITPDSPKVVYKGYGDDFSLPCQAKGVPEPSYEWLRDGIPLIVSPEITFDSVRGDITFTHFTPREEGVFTCVAKAMFGTTIVKSFAPTYTLKQSRVDKFKTNATSARVVDEYSYIKLECANKGEAVGKEIQYNWYDRNGHRIKIDDRQFIDQYGNLHFAYATTVDGIIRQYMCGITATGLSYIQTGGKVLLTINPINSSTAIDPQVQYTNSRTTFLRFSTAALECFFSGYDPQYPNVPVTKWYFDDGNEIKETSKYSFSADHRRLIIYNLDESDGKKYYCQAQNTRRTSDKEAVFLYITSSPIFYPNGAPVDQTILEGKDAVYNCNARSARGEIEPGLPVWYINGQQVGTQTDKTKFVFSDGNKMLTIKSLKKATDIMCIQCSVSNLVGTTWADGCLNVLLPITILYQPPCTQNIDYGDTIDLTVTAITDPSQNLTYRWKHNNVESINPPPFVIYNSATKEAYVNTSNLNIDQYESVRGNYIINVTHNFDYRVVEVNVVLREKPNIYSQSDVRLPPNVITPDSPKVVYKGYGDDFSLPCQAKGVPEPSYEWLRDGIPLIVGPQVTFDSVRGDITFTDFTTREEGVFTCVARATFGTTVVKSFAPTYTLKQSRVDKFKTNATRTKVADEYSYFKLECDNKGKAVGEEIEYNWYGVGGHRIKIDDRQFIDQYGNLHFAYATRADGNMRQYKCGITATGLSYIQLSGVLQLAINSIASPTAIDPQVQYTNSHTKFLRFSTATLECFFSGYDPQYPNVPVTKWYFDDGNEIKETSKYTFSADHRRLIIYNVDESDGKNYYCQAQNTRRTSNKEAVFLYITSSPIFYPNGAPVDQTISEGKDAVFNCNARSARGEIEPDLPVWYINGQQVGTQTDKTKFVFSDGNKMLTIKSLKRDTDIMCIQCSVSNPVGTTWANGCLNFNVLCNITADITALICVTVIAAISIVINVIGCVIFICRPKWCTRKNNDADTYDVVFNSNRTGTTQEDEHLYERVVNEPAPSEEVLSDYLGILD